MWCRLGFCVSCVKVLKLCSLFVRKFFDRVLILLLCVGVCGILLMFVSVWIYCLSYVVFNLLVVLSGVMLLCLELKIEIELFKVCVRCCIECFLLKMMICVFL